jgi:hypothetical protein
MANCSAEERRDRVDIALHIGDDAHPDLVGNADERVPVRLDLAFRKRRAFPAKDATALARPSTVR